MRMTNRPTRSSAGLLVLSLTSLLLLGGSAYALWAESGPYLFAGSGLAQRVQSLADGKLHSGLSRPAHDLVLDDCVQVAGSLYGLSMPTEPRNAALATCTAAAAGFADASPAYSYAYYVKALMAAERNDPTALNAALAQARAVAPTEQWLAELRVKLAEDHLPQLQPSGLAGHEADLGLLVTSQRGIRTIARRYATVESFRSRITAIVEKLPVEQQKRFIAALRSEIAPLAAVR
jgi:hypothetical protein